MKYLLRALACRTTGSSAFLALIALTLSTPSQAQFGLVRMASYTWLRNASPARMSARGWSSFDVPELSSMNRGSTNDTCGSVPLAQRA